MLQIDGAAKTITADEVERFTPGKPLQIYIMVVGVKPGLSKVDKRIYSTQLIKGLLDEYIEFGHKGALIRTIIARSGTPDGIHILRHMGFTETTQTSPRKRNFIDERLKNIVKDQLRIDESDITPAASFVEETSC